jgi:serine/threonine-protein kinase RsbW
MPRNQKELKIDSETVKLVEVEEFIENVFVNYGLPLNDFHNCVLCVKEAVTNSIIHGNKMDRNKKVCIKAYRCNKYLYFKIIDEGEGFDISCVTNPTEPENILQEGGRGLFIIKNLSDEISFKDNGKVIEFKINLHGKS